MIVVGQVGQNVFDITSVSVPTFYIVHRFHLSMSKATLVFDSSPLCRNNDLLTAVSIFLLFVVDLVVDSSPSCSIMFY